MIFHSGLPPSRPVVEPRSYEILQSRLADAHLKMAFCTADLECLAAGANPGDGLMAPARLRIRQANFERRRVIWEICEHLVSHVSARDAEAIRQFQPQDMAMLRIASDHLRHWTPHRVRTDWSAYCEALRALIMKVRDEVEKERALLVPLLAARRDWPWHTSANNRHRNPGKVDGETARVANSGCQDAQPAWRTLIGHHAQAAIKLPRASAE